ncbi:Rad52/Rad22 family DNA repair protein [Anaeromyxobacter sp. SG26]|uniref:Rad52/Rad22 family DNA repair protein n=1 Tax=Anaeromyxobacter sp. SG26 TaxID=2925407 RepID=UPI001F55C452|nr:Rad52/Rad22 family DNA repair protein [Anaeromyxobacter sp. SG26]
MTHDEKKKIYAALAAPFPENAIQRTEGRITGRGFDTTGIGYQFICNRLNEVLGVGGWRAHRTVTVKEITTAKGRPAFEAICDLTLELGSWENGEFVVFAESLADGGHTSMSEADARKGAFTNALKKAAAMFGCGRQAYEGTLDDDNVPQEVPADPPAPLPPPPHPAVRPAPTMASVTPQRSPAPQRSRLTSKQLSAIWAIGRKLGYEQQALRQHIKTTFGVQPEFLSREQASQAIGALSAQAGNGHDTSGELREPGMEG